ncbi:SQSTM1 [Acanthosepion pharaonis]|uniref:SQSTM1 n=1 Tax=Acanthosepion pharaonis TaxID=158019 RepID=A0A812DM27_ACAPH|nr:SQSTM1 [Sepia pharaonis]
MKFVFFLLEYNDGDLIHFTSNSELAEAIKSTADGVFKLYAQEKPLFKDSAELHLGVVCSTCKKPIQGSRYKCLACHDYDLCHSCELIGTHLEHAMIKIPTPSTPWVAQIMQYSYTYGPMSPVSPMLLKCRTEDGGSRSALPLNLDENLSPIMDRPSFASSIGQPYSRNDWSLFSDSPMSSRSGVGQAAAMEHSYHSEELQSRQSRMVERDSLGTVDKSSYRESLFSYNESPQDKISGDWTILNSSSKSKDTNEVTSTVTSIESSGSKTQTEFTKVTEISSEKEASSANMANSSEMNSVSSEPKEDEQEKSISAAIDNTVEDIDTKLDTTTTRTTMSSENGSADPGTETVSSTTNDSKDDKEATKTEGPGEPKPKVDNNLYYPKIRRYAEALDNLMSMGFTNEGGWLTVLVEEKRGDIIRVLDFIENNIQKCRENEQAKSRN